MDIESGLAAAAAQEPAAPAAAPAAADSSFIGPQLPPGGVRQQQQAAAGTASPQRRPLASERVQPVQDSAPAAAAAATPSSAATPSEQDTAAESATEWSSSFPSAGTTDAGDRGSDAEALDSLGDSYDDSDSAAAAYSRWDTEQEERASDAATITQFTRVFTGHRNSATIKETDFFGPHSEFVASGSDDGAVPFLIRAMMLIFFTFFRYAVGHAYIWDKSTGEVLNVVEGDRSVVNCVKWHPIDPVFAVRYFFV
jgi:hypothetical protein